ncbi:hypothetical protein [Brevundimonas sp. SH203]|nr:hypothetical protein [Brevundimonas sp. SH203]
MSEHNAFTIQWFIDAERHLTGGETIPAAKIRADLDRLYREWVERRQD